MEAAALNPPPPWLEKIVLALIPPAAREAVAGDLCEMFQSPAQYAREALRTVPFVIASQMRRNLNPPLLALQGSLVFYCVGGLQPGAYRAHAVVLTSLALLALVLRGAYQPVARPDPRRAIRVAVLVAFCVAAFSQLLTVSVELTNPTLDWFTWARLSFIGPMLLPLLCFYRAGLIWGGDRRPLFEADQLCADAVVRDYQAFTRRVRWRNGLEAGALVAAVLTGIAMLPAVAPWLPLGFALICVYMLVALYLLLFSPRCALAAGGDFLSLRALYQCELVRQQQLRGFLWWLWLAPAVILTHRQIMEVGRDAHRPLGVIFGGVIMLLMCFCISVLNREYGGRVQEKIGLLDRIGGTHA